LALGIAILSAGLCPNEGSIRRRRMHGVWTVLTLLTALTVLTADIVDEVDIMDWVT
jgi:uncharacterized integral membrane protein